MNNSHYVIQNRCYAQFNTLVMFGGIMEFSDVRMGFVLGTLKEIIIEPSELKTGWVIMLRDLQDNLTPLTKEGERRIFEDLYIATSFAHCLGTRHISILESFV